MKITLSESVLPEILEALGFHVKDNGYIYKNGEKIKASDGDKIHYKEIGMIKKNEEGEKIFVRNNFAEYVNDVAKTEQEARE